MPSGLDIFEFESKSLTTTVFLACIPMNSDTLFGSPPLLEDRSITIWPAEGYLVRLSLVTMVGALRLMNEPNPLSLSDMRLINVLF